MENNNVISIHAPLRERRQLNRVKRLAESISIHAPLRERLAGNIFNLAVSRFQSTLPYGSDSSRKYTCSVVNCHFNPRSLTGATSVPTVCHELRQISIHAPLRERLTLSLGVIINIHFNPRSLTGATQCAQASAVFRRHFNPRSLTGATRHVFLYLSALQFQSTLPYGSDLVAGKHAPQSTDFNPRSLTGATNHVGNT